MIDTNTKRLALFNFWIAFGSFALACVYQLENADLESGVGMVGLCYLPDWRGAGRYSATAGQGIGAIYLLPSHTSQRFLLYWCHLAGGRLMVLDGDHDRHVWQVEEKPPR